MYSTIANHSNHVFASFPLRKQGDHGCVCISVKAIYSCVQILCLMPDKIMLHVCYVNRVVRDP